ncbi:hypothetical protein CspHIS471_0100260 [Cutaneotrichosporon sp. HIS471]|nr:hypothetical protein CspHIS471_0100260 [Cutaneotrichosporon sp. HIS471]
MALGTGLDDEAFIHAGAFIVAVGQKLAEGFYFNPECHSLGWSYVPKMLGIAKSIHYEPKDAPPEAPKATATASGDYRFAYHTPLVNPTKAMVTCIQDDAELNASGTFKAPGSLEDVGHAHTPGATFGVEIEDGCDGW